MREGRHHVRRERRAILWRLVLCLLFGTLLTLVSAWLPAARSLATGTTRRDSRPLDERAGPLPYLGASLTKATCAEWLLVLRVDHVREYTVPLTVGPPAPSPPEETLDGALMTCAWPLLVRRFQEGSPAIMLGAEATGWPMRALWCEYEYRGLRRDVHGGLELPGWRSLSPLGTPERMTLPLRPIWSGLAIDLAFWSAAGVPLVLAPMAIRRLLRRRGACPGCGYDLAGLPAGAPCSECGAPVQVAANIQRHRRSDP